MGWSTPRTWVNGEIPTQTEFNTDVRDNMRELWHEVAYVEFTADVTVTSSVTNPEATPLDIVSAGALTYVANPIMIEFWAPGSLFNSTSGVSLWDATTDLGRMQHAAATGGENGAIHLLRRMTPSAASHTYKLRLWCSVNATNTIHAGAGGTGVNMPGFIRILQRGG